jgi:preprotein translocase subunit SecD
VTDLEGNRFMLIEIAGATPNDLEELIGQQGKFEASIANQTVFEGGSEDIGNVCRKDATCSGIRQCNRVQGGYGCQFMFTLYLTPQAAQRHADITANVSLDTSGRYLSEKLILRIDGEDVDSLLVGADLRGRVTTDISIQGPGTGATEEQAIADARAQMNKLQTILITGSLPYKLEIVKLDTIAPVLGDTFGQQLLLAGLVSIVLVSLIVFLRYRALKASLAILFTSFSEIIIILGFAALIGWNLDLPSIAGILATIGTGVDQQIVILDEARKQALTLGERMKRALFIVMSAYMTALVSLVPLYWAGAGLFKGFALTTIIGISAGVFISRPAFAALIERFEENN